MARIAGVTSRAGLTPAQTETWDELMASRGHVIGPFEVLLHAPELCKQVGRLGALVRFSGGLPKPLLEVAILTTARSQDAQFEWAAHAALARKAGVGEGTIAAIRERTAPAGLSPDEALVFRYVDELLRTKRVSQAAFDAAMGRLGKAQVLELTVTAGYYSLLGAVMNAFEVEPGPGEPPLPVAAAPMLRRLNEREMEIGGLHFAVYYTEAGTNGGPTIRVLGDVDGKRTELLRFDSFRKDPHYHAPASAKQVNMTAEEAKDALGWIMTQVREHLPAWLEKAGFGEMAKGVDAAALRRGWTQVRDAALASVPQG
ncbi:MAG: hypothetical protein EXR49_08710 [Dehalococcoidia bacterium]|nr:hypothetical protein [Dehalococcoidia bacterium]